MDTLTNAAGASIAYELTPGDAPTVVFLCGYASHMGGTKAVHLEHWCRRRGHRYLRFDYQGHGASHGEFCDGSIGQWTEDALDVIRATTRGPLVLVGSSMGAWIMLLAAERLKSRISGLLGVASAPDFSEDLIWDRLTDEERAEINTRGIIYRDSPYSDSPQVLTRHFMEEARAHLVLRAPLSLECPVRLIHGLKDRDIPWQTSKRLLETVASTDVRLTLIKNGDHRLSEPDDLATITGVLAELLETVGSSPEIKGG